MQIYFWWNSFIQVECHDKVILCDPWINELLPGYGWLPDKEYSYHKVENSIINADIIYISHIHYDHLDLVVRAKP